jgi:hypothetical protein
MVIVGGSGAVMIGKVVIANIIGMTEIGVSAGINRLKDDFLIGFRIKRMRRLS